MIEALKHPHIYLLGSLVALIVWEEVIQPRRKARKGNAK